MPAKVWIGVDIGGTKTAIVVSKRRSTSLGAGGPDGGAGTGTGTESTEGVTSAGTATA